MYVCVLVSEGLQTPRWEEYLPCGMTRLAFCGPRAAEESIRIYAARLGIPMRYAQPQTADSIIAFWNGTPDFVDATIATASTETHVFLPNEGDDGYTEYTSSYL